LMGDPEWGVAEGCLFSASFQAYEEGKPIVRRVELPDADDLPGAYQMANAKEDEFTAEFDRAQRAGRRKFKVAHWDKQTGRLVAERDSISDQIASIQAASMVGIAIQLAIIRFEEDWLQEPAKFLVFSAYDAAVSLTGVDYFASVERY
jgi:hypothetical protein